MSSLQARCPSLVAAFLPGLLLHPAGPPGSHRCLCCPQGETGIPYLIAVHCVFSLMLETGWTVRPWNFQRSGAPPCAFRDHQPPTRHGQMHCEGLHEKQVTVTDTLSLIPFETLPFVPAHWSRHSYPALEWLWRSCLSVAARCGKRHNVGCGWVSPTEKWVLKI